jgi:hypothetical protein
MLTAVFCLFQTAEARPKEFTGQVDDYKLYDWKLLQKNNLFHGVTNYGVLGQLKGGSEAGGFWPAPTVDANGDLVAPMMNYIYGWGLWVGAQVKVVKPGKTRDTLVTVGYNPNNGSYEYTPGGWTDTDPAASNVKIYSSLDPDWGTGSSPDSVMSVEDTWCQYNDRTLKNHAPGGRPLNIQVTQTSYQWNYPTNQDIIFFLFEIKNCGSDSLYDVYLAPTADCDIGNEAGTAANDVCFFDQTTNMAYQYQVDPNSEDGNGWTRDAGCVGFMFLESPIANKAYSAPDGSGYTLAPGDTIGLFAFKVFNINIDPPTNLEQYKEMAGYNYQTGEFLRQDPKPASGDQRFMESTGPIDMAPGQTAKTIVAVMCANFNYAYLDINDTLAIKELRAKARTAKLIYDAGWLLPGPPPSPKISLTPGHRQVIVSWDESAEDPYDARNKNYTYYRKVTSDSTNINKFDPNFKFDTFEGYKLYKSENGSDWTMLGQWDRDDKFLVDSPGVYVTGPDTMWAVTKSLIDTTVYTRTVKYPNFVPSGTSALFGWQDPSFITDSKGSNGGLQYSYCDQGLINGFTYYYAVVSYGINWQTVKNTAQSEDSTKNLIYFETSRGENVTPVIPRSDPNDYVASQVWVSSGYGTAYKRSLFITPNVDLPRAVKAETYRQVWGPVTRGKQAPDASYVPKVSYRVLDSRDSAVVDWTSALVNGDTIRGGLKWNKEIKYTPGNYISINDNIYNVNPASFAVRGTVPVYRTTDTVSTAMITTPNMKWAFRSGRIEIRWTRNTAGDTLFPSVWHVVDSVNNIVVQVPYDSTGLNNILTSSWNVGGTGTGLGRRYVASTWPAASASYMNICGIRLYFNRGSSTTRLMTWANRPANGEVWVLNTSGITVPTEGEYQVVNTSEYRLDPSVVDMSKVKVVPNPYIVRNLWERTNNREKLQFVNLPSKCTIKVFTIAGNLVKILEHEDNNGIDGGTCWWDPMLTMNQQHLASGVYLYYVDAPGMGTKVGKFAVVR